MSAKAEVLLIKKANYVRLEAYAGERPGQGLHSRRAKVTDIYISGAEH